MMTSQKQGIKLKCQNCGNVWLYKGANAYFAPCSHCKSSVSIKLHAQRD